MPNNIKIQEFSESKKNVQFKTKVSIDDNGICRVTCSIQNTNSVTKHKVETRVQIVQKNQVILVLSTDPVVLYGTLVSRLSATKKSRLNVELYGTIDFDDIDLENFNVAKDKVKDLDVKIDLTAAELRRASILKDEILKIKLIRELNELKKNRADKWEKSIYDLKSQTFSVSIHHDLVS